MENKQEINIRLIQKDIDYIKSDLADVKEMMSKVIDRLESNYVTQIEFRPIKNIVYGMVGIVLVEVLGIILFVAFGK